MQQKCDKRKKRQGVNRIEETTPAQIEQAKNTSFVSRRMAIRAAISVAQRSGFDPGDRALSGGGCPVVRTLEYG